MELYVVTITEICDDYPEKSKFLVVSNSEPESIQIAINEYEVENISHYKVTVSKTPFIYNGKKTKPFIFETIIYDY